MRKATILSALALFLVFGAFGAVYKFYFEPKMQEYQKDKDLQAQLKQALDNVTRDFEEIEPQALIAAWSQQVIPWTQALDTRSTYFHFDEWEEHPEIPADGPILKFWYKDTSRDMLREAYDKAVAELQGYYLPGELELRRQWQVPDAEQWAVADEEEVEKALRRLSFGISALDLLIENDVTSIQQLSLWPRVQAKGKGLERQTLGLSFTITTDALVEFVNNLESADRYYTIEAMRVTYPWIAYEQEPQLNVEMILTLANYVEAEAPQPGGLAAPGAGAGAPSPGMPGMPGMPGAAAPANMPDFMMNFPMFGGTGGQVAPAKKPNVLNRAWRWFKRTVLVMN